MGEAILKVRIIGGQYRGRRLRVAPGAVVRPTPDRVRETLFNWLAPGIVDAQVLDAFAGSGALGIEALSRGAARVVMLDRDSRCVAAIREQLQAWPIEPGKLDVRRLDALAFLATGRPPEAPRFDVVFLDPPFDQELWSPALRALENGDWLAPRAWVYLETPARKARDLLSGLSSVWLPWRESVAGEVGYHLYRYNDNAGSESVAEAGT